MEEFDDNSTVSNCLKTGVIAFIDRMELWGALIVSCAAFLSFEYALFCYLKHHCASNLLIGSSGPYLALLAPVWYLIFALTLYLQIRRMLLSFSGTDKILRAVTMKGLYLISISFLLALLYI